MYMVIRIIIGIVFGIAFRDQIGRTIGWCIISAQVYPALALHWLSTGQWKFDGKMPRYWMGKPNELTRELRDRLEILGEDPWK